MRTTAGSWRAVRHGGGILGLLLAAGLSACSTRLPADTTVQAASMDEQVVSAPASPSSATPAATLGTQWGEARESIIQAVRASRLTPDQPRAVGQMHYSDEASIRRTLGSNADSQLSALLADGDVDMRVDNGTGSALRIFSTRGSQDYYVAGRAGERYELVYTNHSKRDYEVVVTVDGLDVRSGQPGSVRNGGYLLRSGKRLVISGFRTSDREVAAFRFSGKDRAYASNTPTGNARNIGVIGTALFEVRLDERNSAVSASAPGKAPGGASGNASGNAPQAFPADGSAYAPAPQYRQ